MVMNSRDSYIDKGITSLGAIDEVRTHFCRIFHPLTLYSILVTSSLY